MGPGGSDANDPTEVKHLVLMSSTVWWQEIEIKLPLGHLSLHPVNHQLTFVPLVFQDQIYAKNHGMDTVYTIGITIFKDKILGHEGINKQVQWTMLGMIEGDRKGALVNR